MDQLNIKIKSADSENAKQITDILYRLVDDKKIESFKIKKIVKGKNSIDLSPLVPILGDVDFETLYQTAKDYGLFALGQGYIGLKIIREILSVVKDGIKISEKIKEKKSLFGFSCNINRHTILKYGRSFGVEPFDTILTSATKDSFERIFLNDRKWGEIKIAQEKYFLIQHIAIFVKHPIGAIVSIGDVKDIQFNPATGKSTIFLDGEPRKIRPIPYNGNWPHHNAHGTVYTTLNRIETAETLADVYPSLDKKRKQRKD